MTGDTLTAIRVFFRYQVAFRRDMSLDWAQLILISRCHSKWLQLYRKDVALICFVPLSVRMTSQIQAQCHMLMHDNEKFAKILDDKHIKNI